MEESRTAIWVLRNLWKVNSICSTKLPILDTIFRDDSAISGLYWLFTSSDGIIRKKSDTNSHMDEVKNRFLTYHLSMKASDQYDQILKERKTDPIVASLIDRNSFTPISRSLFIEIVNVQSIDGYQAVQSLRPTLGNTSRIVVEMKTSDGLNLYKYYKLYVSNNREIRTTLSATSICETLKKYCDEIQTTIERNTRQRITYGCFLFLEDCKRAIWFMGSIQCNTKEENTSGKMQNRILNSVCSTRSCRSASASRFISPLRKNCAGDFCSFLLKSDIKESKTDLDTDELLQKVRSSYGAEGDKEANKIKLTLAVDYLQREKERLRPKNISNLIPFKYIMLGKELLKGREDISLSNDLLLEIDLKGMIDYSKTKLNLDVPFVLNDPHLHPSRIYDSVKVCDRCYDIYTTFKNHLTGDNLPRHKTPIIARSLNTFKETPRVNMKRDLSTVKISATGKRHYFNTPLGKINKNSINDMLIDMNHAIEDMDFQKYHNSDNLQEKLKTYYETKTEDYKKSLIKQQIQEEPEFTRCILPHKIDSTNIDEEITNKVFSTENTKKWNLKHKDEAAQESWRNYLKWLRVNKIQSFGSLTSR